MSHAANWKYADSVPMERQTALTALSTFEELAELASAEITRIRARVDPGRDCGLTHCLQPVFSFELPTAGDRLFNGAYGYRAQYWRSPFEGLRANALLIKLLTPKLVAIIDEKAEPDFAKFDACAALRAVSAKFWIQEIPSLLANPTVELSVARWCAEAQRGVQLAKWGLSAPEVTRFDVKGSLMDAHGNEVVPARKVRRHYDIHNYGFS